MSTNFPDYQLEGLGNFIFSEARGREAGENPTDFSFFAGPALEPLHFCKVGDA